MNNEKKDIYKKHWKCSNTPLWQLSLYKTNRLATPKVILKFSIIYFFSTRRSKAIFHNCFCEWGSKMSAPQSFFNWMAYLLSEQTEQSLTQEILRPYFTNLYTQIKEKTVYHGYCIYRRNAAVIFLWYTMLRHNGLWKVVNISPSDTIWRYSCIWRSKSCQFHVDFTFQMLCWPCIFRISM